ncbi:MAG: rRNA maturation RNase YbeY [Firmicutes bacterium]|nr:rRNA maturation RNase YbeY [Bacillota bacterium]
MSVLINNMQDVVKLEDSFLAKLANLGEKILRSEKYEGVEASIIFVDDHYIKALNQKYRHIEQPTDVLAFPLRDELSISEGEKLLGDVYISLERAQEQAREYGHSLEREVAFLMTHGLLHLLGYDHHTQAEEKQMRCKQEQILLAYDLGRLK